MKTTKKKAVKKSAVKSKKKSAPPPKAKVAKQPQLPVDYYHVDIKQENGTYVAHPSYKSVDEDTAKLGIECLKGIGLAGRLVHFDGTPEGRVVETWGSVEDVEKAMATEVPQTQQVS